jgi:ribosomal protein S18 acetylase RimI-like enzyme
MRVRAATPSDLGVLAELRAELVGETFTRPYPPPDWEERREIFEKAIANGLLFVAESRDGIVGFVVGGMQRPGVGALDFLHVRPAARRRGVARSLVAELAAALAVKGADWVHVDVEADNPDARAVYERWGFTQCSVMLIARIDLLREHVGGMSRD